MGGSLEGITVGVTADRRSAEQIRLLEGRGATCVHGPVIRTDLLDRADQLAAVTGSLARSEPALLVLTTGLGVRSWFTAAREHGFIEDLGELFGRSELWARGPKAARAIRSEGFEPTWQAPGARYDDVVERFGERLDGEIAIGPVGVQVDGAGAASLCDRLEELGGVVTTVPLYKWSLPSDPSAAEALIGGVLDGEIQAVTFTAKPAVENLLEIAERMGSERELVEALTNSAVAACVGPVCASAFDEFDSIVPLVPEQHRLGAMVKRLGDHFGSG